MKENKHTLGLDVLLILALLIASTKEVGEGYFFTHVQLLTNFDEIFVNGVCLIFKDQRKGYESKILFRW